MPYMVAIATQVPSEKSGSSSPMVGGIRAFFEEFNLFNEMKKPNIEA